MPNTTDDLEEYIEHSLGYSREEAQRLAEGAIVSGIFDTFRSIEEGETREAILNQIVDNYVTTGHSMDYRRINTTSDSVRQRVMKAMHTKYIKRSERGLNALRSAFMVGCAFKGIACIKEYDDLRIFIPESEYCSIKCVERIYNKQKINKKPYNAYGMSLQKIRDMMKQNLHEEDIPDIIEPKIIGENDEGDYIFKFDTTDKSKRKNTGFTMVIINVDDEDVSQYHAVLVKSNTVDQEILNHIIDNITLYEKTRLSDEQCKLKNYKYKAPTDMIAGFDIETGSNIINGKRHQVPEGISYAFADLKKEEIIYKSNVVGFRDYPDNYINEEGETISEENRYRECYEKFLDQVTEKFLSLGGTGTLFLFAHNGGCFDNIYAKGCKNIKLTEQIKKGRIKKLKAVHRTNGVEICFLDTFPFFQASLKKSCEYFSIADNKIDFDIVNKSHSFFEDPENIKWIEYMDKDVEVLMKVIMKFETFIRKEFGCSITTAITGIANIAWRVMYNRCLGIQNSTYRSKDPTTTKFICDSRYGGRILHYKKRFNKLTHNSKGLICLDGNSLFPSAMYKALYPVGKYKVLIDKTPEELITHMDKYLTIVEVDMNAGNIRYPLLPYKTEGGAVIYPNGKFRGIYNSVDLQEALNDGYKITKVHRGIYWEKSERIFKDLIEECFNKREEFKDQENPMEYVFKILLNSMYGTLATIVGDYTLFTDELEVKKKVKGHITQSFSLTGGQFEHNIKMKYDMVDKPVHLASFVLANARKIMNNFIRQIGAENVYYSDTDSLYVPEEVLEKAGFEMPKGLCGLKNDYGDGMLIEDAKFLDLKRYFLKFNKPKDGASFKAKFNGLNFKYPEALKNWYEEGATKEDTVRKLYDWFDANPKKITDIKIIQERWSRNKVDVSISDQEMSFQVDPSVRNNWDGDTSYPIKLSLKKGIKPYSISDVEFTNLGPPTSFTKKEGFTHIVNSLSITSALPLVSSSVEQDVYMSDIKNTIKSKGKYETSFLENEGILYKRFKGKTYEFDGNNCTKEIDQEDTKNFRELVVLKGEDSKLSKEQVDYIMKTICYALSR